MSVLDEIKESAESAHQSLDDARTHAQQAIEEAKELEESASGHGWAGVASAMSSAQQSLEEVVGAIDNALEATSEGLRELGQITEEMSSDEVASRLGEIGERFEASNASVQQARSGLDDAGTSAQQADAASLYQLIESAEESLQTATTATEAALTSTGAERTEATSWGT